MKNFLSVCIPLITCIQAHSQTALICGSSSNQSDLSSIQQKRLKQFVEQSNGKISGGATTNSASSYIPNNEIILIPVVVHVIHSGEAVGTNISDDQICTQIDVLNEDFSRTNPDRTNTPYPFTDVAANPRIQF